MAVIVSRAFLPASRRVAEAAGFAVTVGTIGAPDSSRTFGNGKSMVILARFRDARASEGVTPLPKATSIHTSSRTSGI